MAARAGKSTTSRVLGAEVVGQGVEAGAAPCPPCAGRSSRGGRRGVVRGGEGRGDARVHAAADADDGQRRRAHTPRSTPGQRYLWSWTCSRTGRPSSRIQRAELAGSSAPCTGREQHRARARPAAASRTSVARPLVVGAVRDHELHLVAAAAAGRGCASPCGAVSPEPGAFTSRMATARGSRRVERHVARGLDQHLPARVEEARRRSGNAAGWASGSPPVSVHAAGRDGARSRPTTSSSSRRASLVERVGGVAPARSAAGSR